MEENNIHGFSLYSFEAPTNDELVITYTPDSSIIKYSYEIIKDEKVIRTISIINNSPTNIILNKTGNYKLKVTAYNSSFETIIVESGNYIIDKEKPVLKVGDQVVTMRIGQTLDVMGDVVATDNLDGDITSKVTTNINELDLNNVGLKKLTYTVSDEAGNVAVKTINLNVLENNAKSLFLIQGTIIFTLLLAVFYILIYRKSVQLEKKIRKYTIEPINDKSVSLFDNFLNRYNKVVKKVSKYLSKSVFITRYSHRYDKYINHLKTSYQTGVEFIANKILVSIIFLLIAIFSKTIQLEVIKYYEIYFPVLFGFFAPDIIYKLKYRAYKEKLENDLLQAIIIMNNAFKSGRSIYQAVNLVTTELEGPMAEEFAKMNLEMSLGLDMNIVFERFSNRIDLEEVTYLKTSLAILNKTGGNIIKVFSSIEKTLFNKKKLKLELNSLTTSSKLIVVTLFLIPVFFVLFISIINPNYFAPFLASSIGIILTIFMIVYYIIYVILVGKIMKVRM